MTEWLVQPEWDEGDNWDPAVGTGEVVEAETREEARTFYLEHGDGRNTRPHWISVRPVDECGPTAVEAGRKITTQQKPVPRDGEGA